MRTKMDLNRYKVLPKLNQLPRILLFLFMAALMAQPGHAASADLVDRIQKAYANINAFTADFTQTLTHKESGAVEKRNGSIQFQKPLRVRWQTEKPHEETLVINSREIWDYIPEEQIAYRYGPEVAQDSRRIIQVITGQAKLDRDFDVKNGINENGLVKLALFPKEPSTDLVEATIWADPQSGIIQRASVTDFYGNINNIAFKSFKPASKLPDQRFSFTPPKGVDVEDRLANKVRERDLFK